jgi:hypothetical protein
MNKADLKTMLPTIIVKAAVETATAAATEMAKAAANGDVSPDQVGEKVGKMADRILTQDKLSKSNRVRAAVLGVLTAVLSAPPVQAELLLLLGGFVPPAYIPMATALLGAAFVSLSKRDDLRPFKD